MNFLLDRPFSDNAKVSSGPTVTPHSSPASAFASPAEVLLTGAFVIVAILSSLQANPEKTHEQIQTVTVAPSAARGSAQPVLKSALMPPPTVTPRPNPTPRAGVPQETELENGSVDTETAQETAIIPQQTTTPAA